MAAKLGALVWEIAYDQWIDTDTGEGFGPLARRALTVVRATAATAQ
ncbi:hypothetical protein [Streptomyces sp. Tu 6176]|nr:hypothetical protein [Streptomyces sp. Tu 6176]